MSAPARRFLLSLAVFLLSFPLLLLDAWFGIGIFIGLVLSILHGLDLAEALRDTPDPSRRVRAAILLLGVPQALFGLLCAGTGLAIIAWVLYNTFVERLPAYSGSLAALGVGPALVLVGVAWLASAFRRNSKRPDGA